MIMVNNNDRQFVIPSLTGNPEIKVFGNPVYTDLHIGGSSEVISGHMLS